MNNEIITMAHGGGGTRTQKIIKDIILKYLGNPILEKLDDGAELKLPSTDIVFSTDSYVIQPIFFNGGNIGKLAACGTINDIVMQGAMPLYLSLGLIIEEGLKISDLDEIIKSIGDVAKETGVKIVTGDTKVIEHSRGDGIYINTTGIGVKYKNANVSVSNAKIGDAIIITGTLGDHGISVISKRQGLEFDSALKSDTAPLWSLIQPLLDNFDIHVLRDPTRGGVSAGLCDIAKASGVGIKISEKSLPIKDAVKGACSILGFDPLTIANEGKAIIICNKDDAQKVVDTLRLNPIGNDAKIIGEIVNEHKEVVVLKTIYGGERIVEMPSGENLPRIC